jgi:hypothetical protein
MSTTREKRLEWWNRLSIIEKSFFAQKYSKELFGKGYLALTGREIEEIYLKEATPKPFIGITSITEMIDRSIHPEKYLKETLSLEEKESIFGMYKNDFLEPDNMKKLGYELSEDHKDDGYYKYQNNGTIHYNKDYNRNFPEPKGKVLISVNTTYTTLTKENIPYIGIKQDGGTRSVYSGLCPSEDFLIQLLNNIR